MSVKCGRARAGQFLLEVIESEGEDFFPDFGIGLAIACWRARLGQEVVDYGTKWGVCLLC
jgi:hypothetical protein